MSVAPIMRAVSVQYEGSRQIKFLVQSWKTAMINHLSKDSKAVYNRSLGITIFTCLTFPTQKD